MFYDSLTDFESQIETGEIQVALFELLDDSKRVQVVVKPVTIRAHQFIELPLAGMAERRVAEVVRQRQRLGEVLVQAKLAGDRTGDLRHLDRQLPDDPPVGPCRPAETFRVTDEENPGGPAAGEDVDSRSDGSGH